MCSRTPSLSSSSSSRALVLRLVHRRRARKCIVVCISSRAHGRLHKRPSLHIAFMMQRRPALAGNNASTTASIPRAAPTVPLLPSSSLWPLLLLLPAIPPSPRLRGVRFFFFSGNRLVKVITLIIHRSDTPSHLFQWAGRERVTSLVFFRRALLCPTRPPAWSSLSHPCHGIVFFSVFFVAREAWTESSG